MITKLKIIRIKRGLTQKQVAKEIGIGVRQYQRIEAGVGKPSYEALCKLEDLFQLSHRELLAQCDEKEKKAI